MDIQEWCAVTQYCPADKVMHAGKECIISFTQIGEQPAGIFNILNKLGDGSFHCGGWWIFSKGWIHVNTDDKGIHVMYQTHEGYSTRQMGCEGHARCATYSSNGDITNIGKQKQVIRIADEPLEVLEFLKIKIDLAVNNRGDS